MSKDLIEIQGFKQLSAKIKQLPDKVKRSELLKVLGQVANPTVKAARSLAPQSAKPHLISGKRSRKVIQPGNLKRSIGKIVAKRNKVDAVLVVGPRAKGKNDGWYGAFVNSGTVKQSGQLFMERAFSETKGKVTADAEIKVAAYVQKQINRLSK